MKINQIKKKVILTFDYEIFFGVNSGSVEKCLIEPTNRILDVLQERDIKATFFVDILHYMKILTNPKTKNDAILIKNQIKRIVELGSRIELHLHPHWVDAYLLNGNWHFPTYKHYRLQDLDPELVFKLFFKGKKTLEDLAKEVLPNYTIKAFRAGGFCIQPFDVIGEAFSRLNISIDSSVAPGYQAKSDGHSFDFRSLKETKSFYRFTSDPLKPELDGIFYEIPITTFEKSLRCKLFIKLKNILFKKLFLPLGDGVGMLIKQNKFDKLKKKSVLLSLEGGMYPNELIRQIRNIPNEVVNMISHPKSMSEMSFKCLERLIDEGCDFILMEDLLFKKYFNK